MWEAVVLLCFLHCVAVLDVEGPYEHQPQCEERLSRLRVYTSHAHAWVRRAHCVRIERLGSQEPLLKGLTAAEPYQTVERIVPCMPAGRRACEIPKITGEFRAAASKRVVAVSRQDREMATRAAVAVVFDLPAKSIAVDPRMDDSEVRVRFFKEGIEKRYACEVFDALVHCIALGGTEPELFDSLHSMEEDAIRVTFFKRGAETKKKTISLKDLKQTK